MLMNKTRETPRPSILWLEDDPQLVDIFREDFEQQFNLHILNSFSDFKLLSSAELEKFGAFVIDMELIDGKQGFKAIEYLKHQGLSAAILVLSNDESIMTRLEALKLGVDDYMWKAMLAEEIKLRIANSIKRNQQRQREHEITLNGLSLQPLKLTAYLHNSEIDLTKIEFQFINLLMRTHQHPVELSLLKNEVWRAPHVEIGTINTFIWKLNKKLSLWPMRISKDQDWVCLISKDES
jgi:DNA-binding response OmpR family regulator